MQVGDTITIAGVEWKVRPFTAAELEAFDLLAAEHDLVGMAAKLEAMRDVRHGTARERLVQSEIIRLERKLEDFLIEDGHVLRDDLTDEQRMEAFEIAAKIDMFQGRIEDIRAEPKAKLLALEEEYRTVREAVVTAFMHGILGVKTPLDEFAASVNPEDSLVLDEVAMWGKLRAGLSARERKEKASYMRLLALMQSNARGSDSESPPPPPAAPEKPGQSGRSKKSSSRSKAGS